jgi:hypothetical protein
MSRRTSSILLRLALGSFLLLLVPGLSGAAGSVTTEGDVIIGAAAVRQQYGVSGKAVRVGVISDGIKGLNSSIATGDLPPTTFYCQFGSTVTPRTNGPCQPGETLVKTSGGTTACLVQTIGGVTACKPLPSNGDLATGPEGTAMLEIVHDLAPGAELWFATYADDYAAAAQYLAANVDIVVSDVVMAGWFPNGLNTVAQIAKQIVEAPTNRARAFIISVGNFAQAHYMGIFTDSGVADSVGSFHLFGKTSETSGPSTPSFLNRISVLGSTTVGIFLSWDDPARASSNNYDLFIGDCNTLTIFANSQLMQLGSQEPQEGLGVALPAGDFCYAIRKAFGAQVKTLDVIVNGADHNQSAGFNTLARSLVAPADALGDLLAIGAVNWSTPSVIERFSSRGPTFDGRGKPDLVAPDGVSVSGAGGFPTQFSGTSAAAPHVAGLAALLLELSPTLTRSQLKVALQHGAQPLNAGDANTFGAGLVNGSGAATQAVAFGPMLSVSPTGTLDFGTVASGQFVDRTFTVTNTGVNPLSGSVSASAPFTIVAGGSITNLGSGANQIVTVRFSFTTPGTYASNVNFTSTFGGSTSRAVTGTGTQAVFTDSAITTGNTQIKAVHVTELRSTINAVRAKNGLPAFEWTDPTLTPRSTVVRAVHFTQMRTALTESYQAAGKQVPMFTDSAITQTVIVIQAVHLNELRSAALALE